MHHPIAFLTPNAGILGGKLIIMCDTVTRALDADVTHLFWRLILHAEKHGIETDMTGAPQSVMGQGEPMMGFGIHKNLDIHNCTLTLRVATSANQSGNVRVSHCRREYDNSAMHWIGPKTLSEMSQSSMQVVSAADDAKQAEACKYQSDPMRLARCPA